MLPRIHTCRPGAPGMPAQHIPSQGRTSSPTQPAHLLQTQGAPRTPFTQPPLPRLPAARPAQPDCRDCSFAIPLTQNSPVCRICVGHHWVKATSPRAWLYPPLIPGTPPHFATQGLTPHSLLLLGGCTPKPKPQSLSSHP